MRKIVGALSLLILFMSCAREVVEPAQQIAGRFALDDGTGLTNRFVEFHKGLMSDYASQDSYPLVENRIWDCEEKSFGLVRGSRYSIQDGNLLVANGFNGDISEDKDGRLTIGAQQYVRLDGFKSEAYSSIHTEEDTYVHPLQKGEYSVPVTVERPIPAGKLTAESGSFWISDVTVQDGVLQYKVASANAPRTGKITLKYTHAADVTITIRQATATFIRLEETLGTVGYASATMDIPYTIENPVPGSELMVSTTAYWVKDIVVSQDKVSFSVLENNTGGCRYANLAFSYEGAEEIVFNLMQEWSASGFTLTPSSKEVDYTGGSFNFSYMVNNPREDVTVMAISQADWITDVQQTGTTVSYKVSENNSGGQRTGKIKLTYGNYATAEFTVTQSWSAPSFTLTPENQTVDYSGGSFSFSYAVSNPRAGISVTVASQANWITDVKQTGTTVSYKVAENNTESSRNGKIKLAYGDYATAEFTVTQISSATLIIMTPSSAELDYAAGSFSFSFEIQNPHDGVTCTAISQADWITVVNVADNNEVSYTVTENSSEFIRTGKIILRYGTFATAEFLLTQNAKIEILNSITIGKNDTYLLDYYTSSGTDSAIADLKFPNETNASWQRMMGFYSSESDKWYLGVYRGSHINPGIQYGSKGDLTLAWSYMNTSRLLWYWGNGYLKVYQTTGSWVCGSSIGEKTGNKYNWSSGKRFQIGGLVSSWKFTSYTFYGLRLYRGGTDETPAAEYLPARLGNEIGLYNTVSKQFITKKQ